VSNGKPGKQKTVPFDLRIPSRVARWFSFKQKIAIWANFGGALEWKMLDILRPYELFYAHLVLFMAVRYSSWSFSIFFPISYVWTKKNLATLIPRWS
jgi:hypothetical protein